MDVVWVFLTVMDVIQHVPQHGKHRPIPIASVIQWNIVSWQDRTIIIVSEIAAVATACCLQESFLGLKMHTHTPMCHVVLFRNMPFSRISRVAKGGCWIMHEHTVWLITPWHLVVFSQKLGQCEHMREKSAAALLSATVFAFGISGKCLNDNILLETTWDFIPPNLCWQELCGGLFTHEYNRKNLQWRIKRVWGFDFPLSFHWLVWLFTRPTWMYYKKVNMPSLTNNLLIFPVLESPCPQIIRFHLHNSISE